MSQVTEVLLDQFTFIYCQMNCLFVHKPFSHSYQVTLHQDEQNFLNHLRDAEDTPISITKPSVND